MTDEELKQWAQLGKSIVAGIAAGSMLVKPSLVESMRREAEAAIASMNSANSFTDILRKETPQ